MKLTRRFVLRSTAAVLAAPAMGTLGTFAAAPAAAQGGARKWRHGLSLFGEPHYPEGFKHFDYVNPAAPKTGVVREIAFGTFDNFNQVIAGVKGNLAQGTELFGESLTASALDEVSTEYGLLAEAASYPDDYSSVTYRMRANARWHDGKPVTAEDVVYSFDTFKKNSPQLAAYYRHVVKAEKTGEREVTFTFDGPGNRELPQIVGQLPILPQALVGRHRQERQQARRDGDDARAAARLRALPHQELRARAQHLLREGRRLLGQRPQRQCRRPQLPGNPRRILPQFDRGA